MAEHSGPSILLCVGGSIAAYKAADLCSGLLKLGAEVTVALTASATRFIGPATFRGLTGSDPLTDVFDEPIAHRMAHIAVAQHAALVLVAPATANLLAKMAAGIADDIVTTCLLAVPKQTPVLAAPAMNTAMWEHAATRANVELLQKRGVQLIPPDSGLLACGDIGEGRLANVATIMAEVQSRLAVSTSLAGLRVLITAGATREPLDPIRFLSNRSSGKMGFALAEVARERGAAVTVLAGFTTAPEPAGIRVVRASSAAEMHALALDLCGETDVIIAAAAVADYTPVAPASAKLKKLQSGEKLTVEFVRTPDILADISAARRPGQTIVGFAAETHDLAAHARQKLKSKALDLVVGNNVMRRGAGFETDTNAITIIWPDGRSEEHDVMPKRAVADRIWDAIELARRSS
ncbi:MAG: bifunctional phosphopantothenoylcysteine decarboxylase/phosphopantothenate--cysteine ligase CoaBC [Armatimonadetes bacterium]|nr:bifunctional phosphopantothenoylcysteine decarboxylase/phosphopantothenate--cysteine ligase CoaBC [Armatimonadota bacterium]MDE2205200.1 bifunctional phosphopantothenoylcysteine decarboxylase/phosphopantothenate--cysteine ligase CoaBC [Armatimonadota bacterium]